MKRAATLLFPTIGVLCLGLAGSAAYAAHPLITDDTGVQGKGKVQIEVNGEYGSDTETVAGVDEKATGSGVAAAFTYGATDQLDLVLGVPYVSHEATASGATVADEAGLSDMTIEAKWRFFEKDGLSLALKPGITIPTGDEQKGLGSGKTAYSLFGIATKESGPWAFHANLGYLRNEYDTQGGAVDEEKNLWHLSAATEYSVEKNLRIVGNLGVEKNPDKGATDDPAFALLGAIYRLTEDFEIDGGIKLGITDPETDTTVLVGVTRRF